MGNKSRINLTEYKINVEEADITGYVTFWNKLKFLFTNKLYIAQFHLSLNNVVSTKIKVKK